jgi:hypothetical protein
LTALVLAPSIYIAVRYFLGLDVSNVEILLVRGGFAVAFLSLAAFIFAWNLQSATELLPLAIQALPSQLKQITAVANYGVAPHTMLSGGGLEETASGSLASDWC